MQVYWEDEESKKQALKQAEDYGIQMMLRGVHNDRNLVNSILRAFKIKNMTANDVFEMYSDDEDYQAE